VKLYVEDGKTSHGVATILNNEGVKTASGGKWQGRSVLQVVTSRTMLGHMIRDGQPVTDDEGMPRVCWEPIMTPAEFKEVGRRIDQMKNIRTRVGGLAATSPLRGAVWCHECGKKMSKQSKGEKNNPVYRCSAYCKHQVSMAFLETIAISEVKLFANLHPAVILQDSETVDTSDIEQAIEDLKAKMLNLSISVDDFAEVIGGLEKKKAALLASAGPVGEERSLDLGSTWEGMTPEQQSAQVRDLCKIHVRRESPRVRMEWLVETPTMGIISEDGIVEVSTSSEWMDAPRMDLSGPSY
jgi:hypothetical protein